MLTFPDSATTAAGSRGVAPSVLGEVGGYSAAAIGADIPAAFWTAAANRIRGPLPA